MNNFAQAITPQNEFHRGYQKGSLRSPFDQKLSDAKAQEQKEIRAAQLSSVPDRSPNPVTAGFMNVSRITDAAASPIRDHSPLRTG